VRRTTFSWGEFRDGASIRSGSPEPTSLTFLNQEVRRRSVAAERHCMRLRIVRNELILNEIVAEATGAGLFGLLTTRNLLILRSATTAKNAGSIVRLFYKNALALESRSHNIATTVSHRLAAIDRERHPASYDAASHRLGEPPSAKTRSRVLSGGSEQHWFPVARSTLTSSREGELRHPFGMVIRERPPRTSFT
jgi:hypothetical protein